MAGHGGARLGEAWLGKARQAGLGGARQGKARQGKARQAWLGMAWRGKAGQAWPGLSRRGWARRGEARQARLGWSRARRGKARQAWLGGARQGRRGMARLGRAGPGGAGAGRRGEAGKAGEAWPGRAWLGMAGRGKAGAARPGLARRGAARQGKAGMARHLETENHNQKEARPTMQRKRQSLTKPAVTPTQGAIVVEQPSELFVAVEVTGSTSYIQSNFSQKAVEEMLRKHMGHSVQKTPKKPSEVLERATIRNVDGHVSIPPVAFKSAMVSAASNMKALKKTALRTGLFVEGASIPIRFAEMVPRMDMVRTSGMARTPDVRFRPSFVGWTARLGIRFADTFSHP